MKTINQNLKTFFGNKVQIINIEYQTQRIGAINYRVYPCVMLVEGVHHGSGGSGPVYYSQEVLNQSAAQWNNIPVTIHHPVDNQGNHILCNQDGTIRTEWEIGKTLNARFENGVLKADLYINEQLVNRKNPQLFEFLDNGGNLDVSTGMLTLQNETSGEWNGENYVSSITRMFPDHLALLPGDTGACSWNDGCGVRFNSANKKESILVVNEVELMDLSEKIRTHVDSMDIWDRNNERYIKINMLRAVYSNYFIYKQVDRTNNQEQVTLYKQNYTVNENQIEMDGNPVVVTEEVSYKETTNSEPNKEINMAGKTEGKCCEKKVDALIANEKNSFVDTDKDWLMEMNEEQLEKLIVNSNSEVEPKVTKKKEESVVITNKQMTWEEFLNSAPAEFRAVINAGSRELDKKRTALFNEITANEQNKFTEEQLKAMDLDMLENIAALLPKKAPVTYQGMNPFSGVPMMNQVSEEEPYVPQTLSNFKK